MGEYAIRQSDGEQIKIGTCENMYYLRFEDRYKVTKDPHSLDPTTTTGLYWRLPFPDEDDLRPGDYKDYARGFRLYKTRKPEPSGFAGHDDFAPSEIADNPGIMQLHNESGLLVNVKCYHGIKLPSESTDFKVCWNGKSWHTELASIKNCADGTLRPVVHCRFCRHAWSFEWAEVLPFVDDVAMRTRLEAYAKHGVKRNA